MIQVVRGSKEEANAWLSKIPKIQLRLNSHYNACRRNYPFVTVLGFDDKLGLDTFPYPLSNNQPAMEYYKSISQDLTNTKDEQAKQADLQ